MLERADNLRVEVSVLSLREGRSRRLYRCCGTKSELVVSCDGVYSEVLSKRFDSDVKGFLRGLSGGYSLEEVVLISDSSFSGGKRVHSVSGMCTVCPMPGVPQEPHSAGVQGPPTTTTTLGPNLHTGQTGLTLPLLTC